MSEAAHARELHAAGQLDAAADAYRNALNATPDDRRLRRDYGVLLMQGGKQAEAILLLDRPEVIVAADADLLCILALCLRATGRYTRAIEVARQITSMDPDSSLGWLLLGSALHSMGAAAAARAPLQQALTLEPDFGEAWHYLGESLQALRRWDEAIHAYRQAAGQQPTEVLNIALCHMLAGRTQAALHDFEAAARMMPGRADVLAQLAHCQAMMCLHDRQQDSVHALSALLSDKHAIPAAPEPFLLSTLTIPEPLKAEAIRRHGQAIASSHATTPRCSIGVRPAQPMQRIRIGYLSADFGEHAVGTLVSRHFAAHDRSRFEVFGYSLSNGLPSPGLIEGFDRFLDAATLDDASLAAHIAEDRIDVLIDMAGFTLGARPGVLCRRPAPLQWGWLGFVHGQHATWLDGVLLDANIQPVDAEWLYTDRIIRLQGTLFPAAPVRRGIRDRARFCLPENAVVLASFNNTYKLSAALIHSWSRILTQADEAHLMVYLPAAARPGFLVQWRACNGPEDRLHLVDKIDLEAQSDRAATCDLFLDAFQYQAGATAIHAIGNDLPVLSIDGPQPLSRLSASLNRFLGMDALVCRDVGDYIERAVRLARSPDALHTLRDHLRRQVSKHGLFDPRRSAAAIETAILQHLSH